MVLLVNGSSWPPAASPDGPTPITVVIGTPSTERLGRRRQACTEEGITPSCPTEATHPNAKPTGPGLERLGRTLSAWPTGADLVASEDLPRVSGDSHGPELMPAQFRIWKAIQDRNGDHWAASCASSCGLESGTPCRYRVAAVETLLMDGEHVDGARTAYEDELG